MQIWSVHELGYIKDKSNLHSIEREGDYNRTRRIHHFDPIKILESWIF